MCAYRSSCQFVEVVEIDHAFADEVVVHSHTLQWNFGCMPDPACIACMRGVFGLQTRERGITSLYMSVAMFPAVRGTHREFGHICMRATVSVETFVTQKNTGTYASEKTRTSPCGTCKFLLVVYALYDPCKPLWKKKSSSVDICFSQEERKEKHTEQTSAVR